MSILYEDTKHPLAFVPWLIMRSMMYSGGSFASVTVLAEGCCTVGSASSHGRRRSAAAGCMTSPGVDDCLASATSQTLWSLLDWTVIDESSSALIEGDKRCIYSTVRVACAFVMLSSLACSTVLNFC